MATISLLNPLDQPTGRRRLLAELKDGVANQDFTSLRMIVAFAKSGPLLRMQKLFEDNRARGLHVEAIFGIDQLGTSAQALKFALLNFDRVIITGEPGLTFHPKIYAFEGPQTARIFVGSNNLTVGGTESNFEAAIRIDLNLPVDNANLQSFRGAWDELLPGTCIASRVLDEALLNALVQDGTVPDETTMRLTAKAAVGRPAPPRRPRSGLAVVPPSALPARKVNKNEPAAAQPPAVGAAPVINLNAANGLAIQIKPHHNGEIFLSVTAALQNPAFFNWPFNGLTTPKKGSNNAYPQLTPDPIVNVQVYGAPPAPILTMNAYPLNTVYYQKKSEIRITASPLVGIVPDYSVMLIERSTRPNTDYEITIHTPASQDYDAWLVACNQHMPGGGAVARRFGWF